MKIYKFINEHRLEKFKGYIIVDGIVYTNADAERIAIEQGYKILDYDEKPEYNVETEYVEQIYLDEVDRIVEHYEIKPIPALDPEINE